MNNKCERCGRWFESPRERRWCSGACRVADHRDAKEKRESAAFDLLARQSAALASGADPAILAALAREAQRLLERV